MNRPLPPAFAHLTGYLERNSYLESAIAALEWDERTGLPVQAGEFRANQLEFLAGLAHERATTSEYDDLLVAAEQEHAREVGESSIDRTSTTEVEDDLTWEISCCLRQLRRDFDRNKKLPQRLVEELKRYTTLGQQAWVAARKSDDFKSFQPFLDRILNLVREQADCWRSDDQSRYDMLLDIYEPNATFQQLSPVFDSLMQQLRDSVARCQSSQSGPNGLSLRSEFPIEAQKRLAQKVCSHIGFDFERGRLDETDHPFCTTLGPHDHRILTRYHANFFSSGFFGALHEAGHGMYEQGLRPTWFGLPNGSYASLGIHESQSRLWENIVGRSSDFWKWCWPIAIDAFPQLGSIDREVFVADLNQIKPDLIRVEADEITYNLHIGIRFQLESQLIEGDLATDDLPTAWNAAYEKYLGIIPPNDADGVLQDVHWSAGLFGYFPTYTLGNIFAAQLMTKIGSDIPELETCFCLGDFEPLHRWLQNHVFRYGKCLSSTEIVQKATGKPIQANDLLTYLNAKIDAYYSE